MHRIDGPLRLTRGNDFLTDDRIYAFNWSVADGTVFQSEWSRANNLRLGFRRRRHVAVIVNAPDPEIFHPPAQRSVHEKIRIAATSWSGNYRKGFEIYGFLDRHLDFGRYEMSFYGNAPVKFTKIRKFDPLPSAELARALRDHDIYVTASRFEPCSNSLIEALHTGLPAVYRRHASHPSIVKEAGVAFTGTDDVLAGIDRVAGDLDGYRKKIDLPDIAEVAERYYSFFAAVRASIVAGATKRRDLTFPAVCRLIAEWKCLELREKIRPLPVSPERVKIPETAGKR